ncbi:putative membrane protein [Hoyosella altamirensis]|uniref:Putative membrane protein n=1 Tax=Hoyosella altamirensis TaxID=616997 RepID=A0A839RV06_9ACTN|nr:putative membrane protein [Hoyosella altamirensis]
MRSDSTPGHEPEKSGPEESESDKSGTGESQQIFQHGHGHSHGHSGGPAPLGPLAARVVVALLVLIAILVAIGAAVLWPGPQRVDVPLPFQTATGEAVETEAGTVIESGIGPCGSPDATMVFSGGPQPPPGVGYECFRAVISIDSGADAGMLTLFEHVPGPGQPDLQPGDSLRLVRGTDATGLTRYGFYDYERGVPLTLLALAFAAIVILVARWRGFRALLGILVAFLVLVMFVLPALLDGKSAVPVALVGGAMILYTALYLAHGVNLRTSSALLGTLASLALAAILSWLAIEALTLTGLSEEQNTQIQAYLQHVSISGLLLAGFIIGSLGVLNDVTITQAATAFELSRLEPEASRSQVFGATMRVGRDHIASTVYTLVLAYAGSALPLLLLFSVAGRSLGDVITSEIVAIELARSFVGGIALTLSVPLTSFIAVLLARPPGYATVEAS